MQTLVWPDRLRNLSTLMVVALHVSAPIPMQGTDYDSSGWWAGNLWCSLSRPAVPLFVMLSGYLLLSKQYELSVFLKKRLTRILLPALLWFPVYMVYNHIAKQNPATFTDAFIRLSEGPVHYHLWFIYLILGLYLTYPILAPFVRGASEKEFLFFFVMCLYGTWGIKTLHSFFQVKTMLYIEPYTNNAMYFVAGYYIGNKTCKDEQRNQHTHIKPWPLTIHQIKWLAILLALIGYAGTALLSWYSSKAQGSFFPYYYDYLTPTVTIGTVGLFLVVKYFLDSGTLAEWETDLSAASFGIYLIHPLVIDWWSVSGYWQDKFHPALCVPVVFGLSSILSFIAILLIRAVPGGKMVT